MINCVSNLAWNINEEKDAIKVLKKNKIKFLEFAPTLLIKASDNAHDVKKIKEKWANKGIRLFSMQSILYEIENAYIFGSKVQHKIFYNAIKSKIILAKKLGVKVIVFGSPKNRKSFGKKKYVLNKIFIDTFKDLSKYCNRNNITICIEPNPKIYKSDYLRNMEEVVQVVKKIAKKNIKINFDLGASIENKEDTRTIFNRNVVLIGHVQISAPGLKNIKKYNAEVKRFKETLKISNYSGVVSMEVLAQKKNNIKNLKKNIQIIND